MTRLFQVFRFKSVQYLAVETGREVVILEANGASHGAWLSVDSFKKHHKVIEPAHIAVVERLNIQMAQRDT